MVTPLPLSNSNPSSDPEKPFRFYRTPFRKNFPPKIFFREFDQPTASTNEGQIPKETSKPKEAQKFFHPEKPRNTPQPTGIRRKQKTHVLRRGICS
jgi:hypothetical protein